MATRRGTGHHPGHHHGHQQGPSQRQLRVGEEIRHELAELLRRGDFRDPELANLNVTVTEVRISPDLRNATAFVTPLGGGGADAAVKALKRAAPFLRGQIARAMRLRLAPNLFFEADTSFDYASHINQLLQDPVVQQDLRRGGDHEDPAAEDVDEEADEPEAGADGRDPEGSLGR